MTLRPLPLTIAFLLTTMTTSSTWAYLNPSTGRFLQRDSIGYIDGPHIYQYVGSQPQRFVDPSGFGKQSPNDWMLHENDHGGSHFQRPNPANNCIQDRYDSKTLRPIPHGNNTPSSLGKQDLKRLKKSDAWKKAARKGLTPGAIIALLLDSTPTNAQELDLYFTDPCDGKEDCKVLCEFNEYMDMWAEPYNIGGAFIDSAYQFLDGSSIKDDIQSGPTGNSRQQEMKCSDCVSRQTQGRTYGQRKMGYAIVYRKYEIANVLEFIDE